jgi:predicted RNA methylase
LRTGHHNPAFNEFSGRFKQSYHLEMIRDIRRVEAIKRAIAAVANPSGSFLELGCGSGLFTKYAADKFALAIGVEGDRNMYQVASQLCGISDGNSNGAILGDAFELVLGRRFDVLLCEMLSTWLITEPQVPVIRRARKKFLTNGGCIIPRRVVNLFELGNFEFGNDLVTLPVAIPQFTGIPAPTIVTASTIANQIDFEVDELSGDRSGAVEVVALADCKVNAARLSSIVDLSPGVSFYSTDTLMPLTIAPITQECIVSRGEKLIFSYRYQHRTAMEDVHLSVTKK